MNLKTLLLAMTGITTLIIAHAPNSRADEYIPRGLGHGDNHVHWYDQGCCHERDCEPVEPGAIQQTKDGYYIKYLTSRGFIAEGLIPYGSSSIRSSRDAREHACAIAQRVICIYVVLGS